MEVLRRLLATLLVALFTIGGCHTLLCGSHGSCCHDNASADGVEKHQCCHSDHNHDHDVLHNHGSLHMCRQLNLEWMPSDELSDLYFIAAYIIIGSQLYSPETEFYSDIWVCEAIPDDPLPSARMLRAPPALV